MIWMLLLFEFFFPGFLMKIDDEDGMKMRKKMNEGDEDSKN